MGAARGPEANGYDALSSAIGAPVKLNGRKAYGVVICPSSGYRNNSPNGTATGDDPEGMYAVFDGTHYYTTQAAASTMVMSKPRPRIRATVTWKPSTLVPVMGRAVAQAPARALGLWLISRTGCSLATAHQQPSQPDNRPPLCHRSPYRKAEPVGDPRRRRCIWLAVNILRRCPP